MKHSFTTRVLSVFLAVVMVLGMSPVTAFAADLDSSVPTEAAEVVETTTAVETAEVTEVTETTAETETEETEVPETTAAEETEAAETTEVTEETEASEATETTEETEPVVETESLESVEDAALASVDSDLYDTSVSGEYFNVLSENTYNLAPGATETTLVLNNDEGTDRKVAHVFTVDVTNVDVDVLPGYYEIDKYDPEDQSTWKTAGVTAVAQYYQDELGYNVVGAMNTALAYDSNAPYGYMVYNGEVLGTPSLHSGAQTYLAINKDGSADLRSSSEPLTGEEWTAVSANFGWLVKDGALVTASEERTSSDASRSMIGIKADGTLIFCQVDGRNAPVSSGLSNYEMGEMMLALGCVDAVNGDGGGSSSFVSKREGESSLTMRSVPSDGAERPTINSVIIVSKAKATGEFDHAVLASEYEYYAPGTSATVAVSGVDAAGSPAEVPAEGISWKLTDDSFGTVENGVFTSNGTKGDVTIQMLCNEEVVGELTIHVVDPDVFAFDTDSTVLPYGKSMTLGFACTYGEDDWAVCVDGAYTLTLSDDAAATLDGSTLTAAADESKTGVNVTATYIPDTTRTAVMTITFGKGSEVIFDFEDGDISDWVGFDEAKQWNIDNGVENTLTSSNPIGGQFSPEVDGNTFLSTTENGGQVKSGKYALGWNVDNTAAEFANWTYNILYRVGAPVVLRDVANNQNATTFGMWVYIPEGAAGMAMQLTAYVGSSAESLNPGYQLHFYFTTVSGAKKNLNSCTEEDIPESRWVYATTDLTAYNYVSLVDPTGSIYREPTYIRTYVKPTVPAVHTFYFDDFTLDYSTAVEDRVLPTISDVSYTTTDESTTLSEGANISGSTMAFSATVSDNLSLDNATGKIYVDGNALSSVSVSGKYLTSGNVTLTSGVHTVTFEIKDKLGNAAKVTRTFTVSGDAVITLTGHNDLGNVPEYDSIYYVDIDVADISQIDTLTTTLKLQNANTWELDHMIVAEGFEASYSYNEISGLATVKVERTGDVTLTGAQTLVSLPVRVWSWDAYNHVTGEIILAETQFASGNCPIVTIDCEVVYGAVTFVNNAYSGCLGAFGGEISVATNLNDNLNAWHYHPASAREDAAPTCTADGYTGRTYCSVCGSVVDWGTTVSATGHTYEIVGDTLACDCGATITGSGLVEANGKIYCLISDKIVTGWQMVGEDWVYAAVSTKEVQTGEFTVSGLTYTADETGVVVKGAWVTDENGTKYSYGPDFYTRSWHEIDGVTYYFGTDSYIYTGVQYIPVNRNNMNEGIIWYEFTEEGAYVGLYNGFVTYNDIKYYVVDGEFCYGGLMYIDGYYYYARTSGQIVCGKSYWITKNNDLLPIATYTFDEEGRMIDPPVVEPENPEEPEVKNGICADENGTLYYYVDGVKTYGGLMYIDGYYYYARSSGMIVTSRSYWITKNNDLLPIATYTFDAEGKMIDPPTTEEPEAPETPVKPEVKNGICADESGTLYYYVDGVKTYGGLMYIDGYYYYARTSGMIVTSRSYWITKNNDLLPIDSYTFDAEGKMIDPPTTEEPEEPETPVKPEVKNGICADESGTLYYYVDDVKTYGGLMYIDGYYYYARTSGMIVTGRSYWITKNNDLLPIASYTFDEQGRMIDPPAAE